MLHDANQKYSYHLCHIELNYYHGAAASQLAADAIVFGSQPKKSYYWHIRPTVGKVVEETWEEQWCKKGQNVPSNTHKNPPKYKTQHQLLLGIKCQAIA
eukprot:13883150-Ditylum_brightwellii.AAC.1